MNAASVGRYSPLPRAPRRQNARAAPADPSLNCAGRCSLDEAEPLAVALSTLDAEYFEPFGDVAEFYGCGYEYRGSPSLRLSAPQP